MERIFYYTVHGMERMCVHCTVLEIERLAVLHSTGHEKNSCTITTVNGKYNRTVRHWEAHCTRAVQVSGMNSSTPSTRDRKNSCAVQHSRWKEKPFCTVQRIKRIAVLHSTWEGNNSCAVQHSGQKE
jgi:hypothetical protein